MIRRDVVYKGYYTGLLHEKLEEKIKIREHKSNLRVGGGRVQGGQTPLQYFFLLNNNFCLLLSLRMEIKMFSKQLFGWYKERKNKTSAY